MARSVPRPGVVPYFQAFLLLLFVSLTGIAGYANAASGSTTFGQDSKATPAKAFDWVDTSSPRATLRSFLVGEKRYYDLIRTDGYTWQNHRELTNILEQSERLFDLRGIPPGHRRAVAHETTALIREALARVPLPKLDSIPDEDEMAERVQDGKSAVYRVPGTPFEIARIESGPNTGRYQFTQTSVAHAPDFYDEIRSYPYQPDQAHVAGLHDIYFLSPGPLIPREWIAALPEWMKTELIDNRVWQWIMLVLVVAFFTTAILLFNKFIHRISADWSQLNRLLLLLLRPITIILMALLFASFLEDQVRLTGDISRGVAFTKHLLILFASVSITLMLASVLAEVVLSSSRFRYKHFDQQLVRLLIRLVSIAIAVIIIIEEMQQIGFSIATLVAGAGVSGLAVALAAQGALKNIFGGIELALDKPFDVGQRVKLKGFEGYIEEIGLRSTKLRTLEGNQIAIPNEQVANIDVENVDRRPHIRRRFNITLPYDTKVEIIDLAVEILKEILSVPETKTGVDSDDPVAAAQENPHPNIAINQSENLPPRVHFNELNPDSLNIQVTYWHYPPDRLMFYDHAHYINRQIMQRFNEAGIDFAFPSQTIYHAGDDKRPLTIHHDK
jgi:MscS family membrane protein